MKFSFTTDSCPDKSLDEIISLARAFRFNGIELSGIKANIFAPDFQELSDENLPKIMNKLDDSGIEIPLLASHTILSDERKRVRLIQETYDNIDLAEKMGIRYVRVLNEKRIRNSILSDDIDLYFILENLQQICSYAKPKDITILLETNSIFSDSRFLARFIQESGCKNVGVLWDVNHTVRYSFETPKQTANIFGNKIKHVHINDSILNDGILEYKPLGKGDLPLQEIIDALKEINYPHYISFEWPKRTKPKLESADIILPHFLYYIKNLAE